MSTPDQEKSNRIAKNTMFLYGQMFVQMIVTLLMARVLFRALGVVDYGIYHVIGAVMSVFAVLNNIEGATIRFLTFDVGKSISREKVHLMFSTARTVHLVIAGVIFLLAETAGLYYVGNELVVPPERLPATMMVYQFSVVTTLFAIVSIPYEALLIAHEKMGAFASMGIVQTLVGASIVLVVKYAETDRLVLYGVLVMLMQLGVRVMYGIYCKRNFKEVAGKWVFDKDTFIRMLKFAGWTFNGTVAYMAYTEGVNLLLNAFFGPVMNAARGIANTIRQKVEQFASSFQGAVNPQIVKSYAQGDYGYMHKLLITSSRISLLIIFALALPVALETESILHLWLGDVPEYTIAFTRLSLLAVMVDVLGRILIMAIQATGRIAKFQMIEANILLLIVPASYVCLKLGYSPVSVYVTQVVFFVLAHAARIMIVCPSIQMRCRTYVRGVIVQSLLCMVTAAFVPVALLHLMQDNEDSWWRMAIVVATSLLTSAASIYYIGCDKEMRAFVTKKLKKNFTHE